MLISLIFRAHHAKCQGRKAQAGIKHVRRNVKNLRYAGGITLIAKNEEELKSFLIKVKEKSERSGLKLNL